MLPSLSSLLNTSSACARLVPPAPRAFSNSDLLTWPSPSASRGESRCFSASDRLVGADAVEPVDDWLCAASSALMVAGDICEPPLDQDGVELPEAGPLPEKSKGFVELWLKPVDCGAADFGAGSEWGGCGGGG